MAATQRKRKRDENLDFSRTWKYKSNENELKRRKVDSEIIHVALDVIAFLVFVYDCVERVNKIEGLFQIN